MTRAPATPPIANLHDSVDALPAAVRADLDAAGTSRGIKAGERLLRVGVQPQEDFQIAEGRVKYSASDHHGRAMIAFRPEAMDPKFIQIMNDDVWFIFILSWPPFAYDGLISFWFIYIVSFGWIMVMSVCTLRALSRAVERVKAEAAVPRAVAMRPAT